MDIDKFYKDAEKKLDQHKSLIKRLRKLKPRRIDNEFHSAHFQVFEETNCLDCANCCKTTSPVFYRLDIERISKSLKMKVGEFIDTYLYEDIEGDYVLNAVPCPFLGIDNKCIVYESRPVACREYPHTNRKRMHQILNLTLKNSQICPAVNEILKKMNQLS